MINRFIKDHGTEALLTALMLLCLSVFGYTFQETVSLRARVLKVERLCASQGAQQNALRESLNQRTEQIGEQVESLSKSMDTRLDDIRGMIESLIRVLAASDAQPSTAQGG